MTQDDHWTPSGERWAFLFKVNQVLSNRDDDQMEVDIRGWVLAFISDDSVWIDGVYPGGLAAHGTTLDSAKDNWVTSLSEVVTDIARTTSNVSEFRAMLTQFVTTTDKDTIADLKPAESHLAKQPPYCKVKFIKNRRTPEARPSRPQPQQQSNIKPSFGVAVPA